MPLHQRKYALGDRVVMLGKKVGAEVRCAHDCVSASFNAPRIVQEPLLLLEGLVRDVYKDRNGDVIVVRHHVLDAPEDQAGARDTEVMLSERWLGVRMQMLRAAAMHSPDLTPAKIAFLKQFIVPLVITSTGYQAMLRDFAAIVNPELAMLPCGDLQTIQTQATAFGIELRKYLWGNKSGGYYAPFNDKTDAQFEALEAGGNLQMPVAHGGEQPDLPGVHIGDVGRVFNDPAVAQAVEGGWQRQAGQNVGAEVRQWIPPAPEDDDDE